MTEAAEGSATAEGSSTRAIIAAFAANLGIAITKFIAWGFSGSSSMLAEGVHSLADSCNQVLLLVGGNRAKRAADREHPFGYGRERFVYAFVVSIILFSVGGVFSIYEGIEKIAHPHPIEVWWLPLLVLVISICLESFSLRTAIRESKPHKTTRSWFAFIRRAKAPELPIVLLEDVAALIGLTFALIGVSVAIITGDGVWDGIGTVFIGALLVVVAIVLGIETKSLLVGEGASDADAAAIENAILSGGETDRVIHLKTLYLGPEELMVAAKIAQPAGRSLGDVAASIDAIEARVRAAVPVARVIYLEPDVFHEDAGPAAPTETIVIKGED
ncbi:cation diffusion facilitator family transporter [Humibacter sp. RRB41]|uniref:cation diffusion facilitator family transporter n=1 Tax=Humibacter sp. RRB41 TaxID=2919946 RepID=UPI001FA9440C|nr:cation diffusion facilitator family transporter [Humibacter sp. RRB41]